MSVLDMTEGRNSLGLTWGRAVNAYAHFSFRNGYFWCELRVVCACDATIRHSYNLERPRTSAWSALTRREPATDPCDLRTHTQRNCSHRWAWRPRFASLARLTAGGRRAADGARGGRDMHRDPPQPTAALPTPQSRLS